MKNLMARSPNHQHEERTQQLFQFLPGPIKIKDGLFMGDQLAAKDIEFVISNKVTHIINTVSKQIPNLWEKFGIHYLSVNWTQKQENIFDSKNNAVNTIFHFIEEAMQQGESCLVHSMSCKSRSTSVMIAYLMKKYNWGLAKCLEYIFSKKQKFTLRDNYLGQLKELEARMSQIYKLSQNWFDHKNQEELLLTNTLINSRKIQCSGVQKHENKSKKRIAWIDKPTIHKFGSTIRTNKEVIVSTSNFKKSRTKSILKGFSDPVEENQTTSKSELIEQEIKKNIKNSTTINNFVQSEKKVDLSKNIAQSRPYSSDQKARENDKKYGGSKKIFSYDKNPYENKFSSQFRGGSSGKGLKNKKEDTLKIQNYTRYDRPQSVKNKGGLGSYPLIGKQDFMITNGTTFQGPNQKNYPINRGFNKI